MPGVPALYEQMYARRVFTTADAVQTSGLDKDVVVRQLSYLQSHGYVDKIRRGLYAVIPLESRPGAPAVNPYLVASCLASPYVLSYHTGLELHGVAQSTFYRVFVATPRRFARLEHEGVTYQAVPADAREVKEATTQVTVEDQPVAVASREWTVAHCALRLRLAGGLEELLLSVRKFSHIEPRKLYAAARTLGRKSLLNRLGFLLDHFADPWGVTPRDLDRFRAAMSQDPSYFGARPGNAQYVKPWRLLVPDNLKQVVPRG